MPSAVATIACLARCSVSVWVPPADHDDGQALEFAGVGPEVRERRARVRAALENGDVQV